MIYYRCKCGKREAWVSGMPVHPCGGCRECGTTLSTGPEGHTSPVPPHQMMRARVKADEGEAFEHRCFHCMARKKEIEKRNEPWEWYGGSIEAATR